MGGNRGRGLAVKEVWSIGEVANGRIKWKYISVKDEVSTAMGCTHTLTMTISR